MASGSAGLPGHRRRTRGERAPGLAHSRSKAGLALLSSRALRMERESGGSERRHTIWSKKARMRFWDNRSPSAVD